MHNGAKFWQGTKRRSSSSSSSSSSSNSSSSSESDNEDSRTFQETSHQGNNTSAFSGNGYEIESDDDDVENNIDSGSRRRPIKKLDRRCHGIEKIINSITIQLNEKKLNWKAIETEYKDLKKAINKILLINTNSLILRARWKTGGKYYDCKSWEPSMNESNTYNVQFMDGDKRTNVPLNEIKLPSLKLPVSFWILCNHMNHLLSSEVNNRKISKNNKKAVTKLSLKINKLLECDEEYQLWSTFKDMFSMNDEKSKVVTIEEKESKKKKKKKKKKKEQKERKEKKAKKKMVVSESKELSDELINYDDDPFNHFNPEFGELNLIMNEKDFDQYDYGNKIYVRLQQRTRKKGWTIIYGFSSDVDLNKICEQLRKSLTCGGSVTCVTKGESDPTYCIQLQGDHCEKVIQFLLGSNIIESKEQIIKKGF